MKKIIMTIVLAIGLMFGAGVQDATPVSAMTQLEGGFSYDESSIYVSVDTANCFCFNVVTYIDGDEYDYSVAWFGNDGNHIYVQELNAPKGTKSDKYVTGSSSPFVGMFRQVWYREKGYTFS